MKLRSFSFFIFALLLLYSCRKDKPVEKDEPAPVIAAGGGMYIVNEGNYLFGNAKISYYDFTNGSVTEDLFEPANSYPLGDVAQSMSIFNNKAYIVVNNSGKIEVVDPLSFIVSGTITGFTSPRYFLPVSNGKAYVTDLFSNTISIVNLSNNTISGTIACTGWTEELALAYGKVFVTNMNSDKVYVINTATDMIEDSISVGYGSNSIREDNNGKLWILASGNQTSMYPFLTRINPVNNLVEVSFQFPNISDSPYKLNINGTFNVLYYLNSGGVYSFPVAASSLSFSPMIPEGTCNFYGLGVNPVTNEVYVADAIDYVQKGVILRYQSNGTYNGSFQAGIIPGNFCFN